VAAKGNKKIFISPDEGTYLPILDIVHKVTAETFGGALTIEEWGLPPGQMIPPHTHSREDECNFVLEGELTCEVGGEIVVAPVGSYVLKPRECPTPCATPVPSQSGSWRSLRRVGWKATSTSTKRSYRERWMRISGEGPEPNSVSATG
jgi:hypothetical protein